MRSFLQLLLLRLAVASWSLGTRLGHKQLARTARGTFERAAARVIDETGAKLQLGSEPASSDPPPAGYTEVRARGQLSAAVGAALLLVDEAAGLFVPIFVGPSEALAFQHRLAGTSFSRPLPYDLFDRLLAEVGGRVKCARVEALREQVFSAKIDIALADGTSLELDARASDAVIVALGAGAPILASKVVMREVGRPLPEGDDG